MKAFFFICLSCICVHTAHALPVLNPSEPSLLCDGFVYKGFWEENEETKCSWRDLFSFRSGFYGDYVFNRHLHAQLPFESPRLEKSTLFTNASFLTLNFWDLLDLFATLGSTHLELTGNATLLNSPLSIPFYLECQTKFSWSLGGRCTVWKYCFSSIGVEFQYFQTSPSLQSIRIGELTGIYPSSDYAKYREWQIGIGFSQRIQYWVPYIAIKWSHAKLNFSDLSFSSPPPFPPATLSLPTFDSLRIFGYAVGLSLIDIERASLTIEGRFLDEKALHVNAQLRF